MLGDAFRLEQRLTIQARIALLVVACIVPGALLSTFVIYLIYDRERASIEQHALDTTRGLMRVVERDLAANEAALRALAVSTRIDDADFAAFHRQAQDALSYTSGFTIVLTDPSGQQLVNLLRPYGAPLPFHGNPDVQRRVLESRKTVVSDLYIGGVTQKPLVGIEVPVIRAGKVSYTLALGVDTKHLSGILRQQELPQEWVVAIFDSSGTVVARSHAGDQFVGQKGSRTILAALRTGPEGLTEGTTLEGIPVLSAFSRSAVYGWTVAIGVPVAIVTADLKKWLGLYIAGASLLLLAGLGMAIVLGRRIAQPIQALIAPSVAIGEGRPVAIPPLELQEAEAVGHALERAQQLIRQREQERDRAEQAQRKMLLAKQMAEQANAAKAAFLANVSHELRTPLNVILGFSQLLRDAPNMAAAQKQHLEIIVRSGERLLTLINNVLDLTKIESGHVALENARFDLHSLLHEVRSSLHVRAAEKGLNFSMALAPDLPRYVSADSGKLNQVLINLVVNAIKFTGTGKVILRAEVAKFEREPAQRALLRFQIEDSGPGIRAADRQRIFFPFVQLGERQPADVGTGLGLAISKQYIELMGGSIGVTSEPGKGSTFQFEVPVEMVPLGSGTDAANPPQTRIIGLAEGQQRYRLLIAEDQYENRLLLQFLLEPLGFELREAVNGQEAIESFEEWHPHLIWMDIRMPVMDGLEATRRIREGQAGAQTKIVAVTAHALEQERKEILAAGCDDFIRKPYRKAEIFAALEKHLGVRFSYAGEASAAAAGAALNAAQLQRLPPGLLLELREAAVLLDGPRCVELAGGIGAGERELREWLQRMVMDLRYAELLEVLDRAVAVKTA